MIIDGQGQIRVVLSNAPAASTSSSECTDGSVWIMSVPARKKRWSSRDATCWRPSPVTNRFSFARGQTSRDMRTSVPAVARTVGLDLGSSKIPYLSKGLTDTLSATLSPASSRAARPPRIHGRATAPRAMIRCTSFLICRQLALCCVGDFLHCDSLRGHIGGELIR